MIAVGSRAGRLPRTLLQPVMVCGVRRLFMECGGGSEDPHGNEGAVERESEEELAEHLDEARQDAPR